MPPPHTLLLAFYLHYPIFWSLSAETWLVRCGQDPKAQSLQVWGGTFFFRNRKMLCGTPVGPKGRYLLNHWERHTRTVLEWLLCYISCPKTIFTSGEATHLFLSFWAKQLCTHTVLQRATSVLDAATGRILFHKYHRRPGFGFQNANCVGAGKQEPSRGECCSRRL